MSLFPLDLDAYKRWTIRQLYNLLKPMILEDCVARGDFEMVFAPGNLIAGETPVTFVGIQPMSTIIADAKSAEARVAAEEGKIVIEAAQTTGQFTGT